MRKRDSQIIQHTGNLYQCKCDISSSYDRAFSVSLLPMVHFRVLFELIWRDYFRFISIKYGNSIFHIGTKPTPLMNFLEDFCY